MTLDEIISGAKQLKLRPLTNGQIENRIRRLKHIGGDAVQVRTCGTSPLGLPLLHIVISDPSPGPKVDEFWHLDPHLDEELACLAGFGKALMLLRNPERLRGRALHLYLSSPDARYLRELWRRRGMVPRSSDIRTQAGWSLDSPGELTSNSSAGWWGLHEALQSTYEHTRKEDGFVGTFASGHDGNVRTGSVWLLDAQDPTFVGTELERLACELSQPLGHPITDGLYLRRHRGTRACYELDTARARRRVDPTSLAGATDGELALALADAHGLRRPTALVSETAVGLLELRDLNDQMRDEIIGPLNILVDEAGKAKKKLGTSAMRLTSDDPYIQQTIAFVAGWGTDIAQRQWGHFATPADVAADLATSIAVERAMWTLRDLRTIAPACRWLGSIIGGANCPMPEVWAMAASRSPASCRSSE
jgi:hypothetical protein